MPYGVILAGYLANPLGRTDRVYLKCFFFLPQTWLKSIVHKFSISISLSSEIWESHSRSLTFYPLQNQFWCLFGVIVLLKHPVVSSCGFVQCAGSTGSKTAPEHEATTTKLYSWYSDHIFKSLTFIPPYISWIGFVGMILFLKFIVNNVIILSNDMLLCFQMSWQYLGIAQRNPPSPRHLHRLDAVSPHLPVWPLAVGSH